MNELTPQAFRLALSQDLTLTFTLDAAPVSNVSGWSMGFYLRLQNNSLVITKTSGSGITCTDGVNGVWQVSLFTADSDDLSATLANWSFWRVDAGFETPLAVGTCQLYRTSLTG